MKRPLPPVLFRLRIGFCLLWLALLTPVALLLWSTESRLEAQRRLRHEVVAERVFDELERELGALLDTESRRPPYAPALDTDPGIWAPFVVGYFVHEQGGATDVIADARLPADKRERVAWAVAEWVKTAPSTPPARAPAEAAPDPEAAPAKKLGRRDATSPEILRQLNRAQEQKRKAPARPSPRAADPFNDYSY